MSCGQTIELQNEVAPSGQSNTILDTIQATTKEYSTPLTMLIVCFVLVILLILKIEGAEQLLIDVLRRSANKTLQHL